MKKTRPGLRITGLVLTAALVFSLAGCGAKSSGNGAAAESTTEYYAADASNTESAAAPGASAPLITPEATAETSRKIVYTANVDLESTDFAAAQQAILDAVEASGGYLQSTYLWGNAQDADRRAEYSVRVPAENYSSFLTSIGQAGNLLSQSESTDDITSSYIDVEARLSALEAQRDRLNELADQAETTADLLEIESQLSDVQYQLESYTMQLRSMQDQVAYSTVDIYLSEVATLTPTGVSFGDRLAEAFFGGWNAFALLVQNVFLGIVYLLPLILVSGAIIALCVVLGRRRAKRHPRRPRPMPPAPPAPPSGAGPEATYAPPAGQPENTSAPAGKAEPGNEPPQAPKSGPKY